jgi:hypothetical protein
MPSKCAVALLLLLLLLLLPFVLSKKKVLP